MQQSNRREEAVTRVHVQLLWELVESKSQINVIGQAGDTFPPAAAAFSLKNPEHGPQRDPPAPFLYIHFLQQPLCVLSLAPDVLDSFECNNELTGKPHVFLIDILLRFMHFLFFFFLYWSGGRSFHTARRRDAVLTSGPPAL